MLVKKFRGVDFVNREKECEFFINYFNKEPEKILWIYGPKSTGKTTLIEYIIEEKLTNNLTIFDKYWIKYINFRGLMVGSYDSFVNSFFEEVEENDDFSGEITSGFNIGIIKLEAKLLEKIHSKKKNLFNELIEKFKTVKKRKILIIDEIQTLQEIYYNGEKELLNEFLNFCVRLTCSEAEPRSEARTKETHLTHVVILTSNTLFLNKIYNNAKMKKTSEFKLIDHLSFDDIDNWIDKLKKDNSKFSILDSQLIYEYLGGCVFDIKTVIDNIKYITDLKEYLDEMVDIAKNEIKLFFEQQKLTKEEKDKFLFVAKEIIKNNKFENGDFEGYLDIVSKFAEIEILFFDPVKNITTANSKIYVKAFEKLLIEKTRNTK